MIKNNLQVKADNPPTQLDESKVLDENEKEVEVIPVQLEVKKEEDIFDKKTEQTHYFEKVNVKHLNYLINNTKGETKKALKMYKRDYNNGSVKRYYSRGKRHASYGRLYVKDGGLQSFSSNHRAFLCDGEYQDIDCVNSQPNLLLEICNEFNISCDKLTDYCNNREFHLEKYSDEFNLSRNDIKTSIMIMLFGGQIKTIEYKVCKNLKNIDFFTDLEKEVNEIKESLWNNNKFKDLRKIIVLDSSMKNKKASHLSMILQHTENDVLMHIVEYFKQKRCNIGSLIFDGVLIKCGIPITNLLLRGCEEYVKEKTKYSIKLLNKEMKTTIEFKEGKYEIWKNEWELTRCKIRDEPTCFLIERDGKIIEKSKRSIEVGYEEEKEMLDIWFADKKKRMYKTIDYNPKKTEDGVFNLFTGFDVENFKDEDKDPSLILEHIANQSEGGDYFDKYMTHFFQKPWEKPPVTITFIGIEGTGKDTMINAFGKMMGNKYYMNTSNIDDVFGRFSDGRKNKQLIYLNEVKGKDSFALDNRRKTLIDCEYDIIETKGVQSYKVPSYYRVFSSANSDTGVPIRIGQKNRRDVVFTPKDQKMKEGVYEMFKDEGYLKALYNHYMSQPEVFIEDLIDDNRPETEIFRELKLSTISVETMFLDSLITNKEQKYYSSEVHKLYLRYCDSNVSKNYNPKNNVHLGKLLSKIKFEKHKSSGKWKYILSKSAWRKYLDDNKIVLPDI